MNAHAFVDEAREWACLLEDREFDRVGDRESARRKLERENGLPPGIFYSLRYRRRKSIAADIYERLRAALLAAHEREVARLEHEIEVLRASGDRVDRDALAKAEATLRAAKD